MIGQDFYGEEIGSDDPGAVVMGGAGHPTAPDELAAVEPVHGLLVDAAHGGYHGRDSMRGIERRFGFGASGLGQALDPSDFIPSSDFTPGASVITTPGGLQVDVTGAGVGADGTIFATDGTQVFTDGSALTPTGQLVLPSGAVVDIRTGAIQFVDGTVDRPAPVDQGSVVAQIQGIIQGGTDIANSIMGFLRAIGVPTGQAGGGRYQVLSGGRVQLPDGRIVQATQLPDGRLQLPDGTILPAPSPLFGRGLGGGLGLGLLAVLGLGLFALGRRRKAAAKPA